MTKFCKDCVHVERPKAGLWDRFFGPDPVSEHALCNYKGPERKMETNYVTGVQTPYLSFAANVHEYECKANWWKKYKTEGI